LDSGDYLIYDENYRYDGSKRARKMLYLSCGTEVIEFDQVKDQLWVPNLAERIMRGETINSPKLSDLDLCDLIPRVEKQDGPRGEYRFKITPRRGGLGQTVVSVNGLEVMRLNQAQLTRQGKEYLLVLRAADVEPFFVAGEENRVSVRAFTEKNDIGSRGDPVAVEDKRERILPSLHAVVVGVTDYKGNAIDLRLAAKDARDFSQALEISTSKFFSRDGIDRVHIYTAHTDPGRTHFPDKASIRALFDSIGRKAGPSDVLLIFFSGHGVTHDNQFYFLTADASSLADPTVAGISSLELFDWIHPSRIVAQKRVLILDACNSGQAISDVVRVGSGDQAYAMTRNLSEVEYLKALDKMGERSGLFILSAAASNQSAFEMGRYGQGVLTYALLRSVKEDESILDAGGLLQVGRWFTAAEKIVGEIASTTGARQQPQMVSASPFPVGLVDDEVRSRIVLAEEKPVFTNVNFQDEAMPTDLLGLNTLLDKELQAYSTRGTEHSISFYPGSTLPEAVRLSGRYRVSGTNVSINVFVMRRGAVQFDFTVSGERGNLEALARSLVDRVVKEVR
jgi:hypothetical protein